MRIYESNTVVYTWSLGKSGKSLKRFSSQNYESSLRLFWSLSQVFQGGQVLPYLFRDMPIEAHGDLYDTQIWKITPKDITLCFFLSLSLSYQKKKKNVYYQLVWESMLPCLLNFTPLSFVIQMLILNLGEFWMKIVICDKGHKWIAWYINSRLP